MREDRALTSKEMRYSPESHTKVKPIVTPDVNESAREQETVQQLEIEYLLTSTSRVPTQARTPAGAAALDIHVTLYAAPGRTIDKTQNDAYVFYQLNSLTFLFECIFKG